MLSLIEKDVSIRVFERFTPVDILVFICHWLVLVASFDLELSLHRSFPYFVSPEVDQFIALPLPTQNMDERRQTCKSRHLSVRVFQVIGVPQTTRSLYQCCYIWNCCVRVRKWALRVMKPRPWFIFEKANTFKFTRMSVPAHIFTTAHPSVLNIHAQILITILLFSEIFKRKFCFFGLKSTQNNILCFERGSEALKNKMYSVQLKLTPPCHVDQWFGICVSFLMDMFHVMVDIVCPAPETLTSAFLENVL